MHLKDFFISFITLFAITLVVAAIVSFFYSLIVHDAGVIDWEMAFRMAIILGIVLPFTRALERRKKAKTT